MLRPASTGRPRYGSARDTAALGSEVSPSDRSGSLT